MEQNRNDVLRGVFSSILENMAFMFADAAEEEEIFDAGAPYVRAEMTFQGPTKGTIAIAVPEAMCPELAGNILGIDPEDEMIAARPHDALKELLNVTCGNVLTALEETRRSSTSPCPKCPP